MIVAARCYERDRATVFDAIGVCVDTLVQLRRNAESEGPKKGGRNKTGYESDGTRRRAAFHFAASFRPLREFRKIILQDRNIGIQTVADTRLFFFSAHS